MSSLFSAGFSILVSKDLYIEWASRVVSKCPADRPNIIFPHTAWMHDNGNIILSQISQSYCDYNTANFDFEMTTSALHIGSLYSKSVYFLFAPSDQWKKGPPLITLKHKWVQAMDGWMDFTIRFCKVHRTNHVQAFRLALSFTVLVQ